MKKLLFAIFVMSLASVVHAGTITSYVDEGYNASFSKLSISSTTVTTISAYSDSRKYLLCRNKSAFELYIGSFTTIASAGGSTFQIDPSTSTSGQNMYITRGHEAVYGIGLAGSAGTVTLYCVERR